MTETRLDPADHAWMTAPSTRRVMGALNPEDGDQARFVGGCVRNAFLGVPVDDVDIATTLTPDEAVARLEAAGIKVAPTGIEHGTVTAIVDGAPFEVTSLRRDVETFGRRAVVAFTTDWREDALRRDFRLNAIYARPDGTVFDPFGGIADAHARRIIFIGQARDRIAEDHLRILRFYRFTAWYGREIDAEGHRACVEMAETLKALSVERVWKELKKLLAAPDPADTVKAMQEGHVLKQVLTGHIDFNLFFDIINADRGKSRSPDPLLRLVALSGGDEAAMLALCKQMKASNAEAARAKALTMPLDDLALDAEADHEVLSRAVYALGSDTVQGRLRLAEAAHGGDAQAAIDFVDGYEPPHFPLKGRDLIKAGFERGPGLGVLLKRLERDWVDSVFTLDREALLAKARRGARMSEDKSKDDIKSEEVIRTTLERIKAFGYVDRAWILSAFETYFWDVYKPNETHERLGPHPMVWVALAPLMPFIWLAKLVSYPFRQSDIDRSQNPMAKRDPRDKRAFQVNAGLLRSLLNTIPAPSTGLPAQGARRRGPGARSLESLFKTADGKNLKRIAKFLRKSGLEETGFPVRLVGEKGEGAPSAPMKRNAALSVLTGGLLYRFAYDHDKKLKWEDTKRVFRAAGLYRVYVVPPDATYVERRLLLMSLNKDGAIVRAAEIRKRRGQFVVRGGYVIPASGINTFVLSSDFSPDVLAEMIEEGISPAARDIVFPEGVPDEVETSASFLQEHQLGFYSLFSRGEGELRGSLMEAPTPATAVGYRVEASQIDLSDPPEERPLIPPASGDTFSDAPDLPRRRHPELGFLTLDEIEDRRDQILVAAVSRNPAVSIDIG